MSKRFQMALDIQYGGASNPSGIARTLREACKECLTEGVSQRTDPAVRLIVHQLAHLCSVSELDSDFSEYSRLLAECEQRIKTQ